MGEDSKEEDINVGEDGAGVEITTKKRMLKLDSAV